MSLAVPSVSAKYNPALVAQIHELAPSPEREIIAVTLLSFFEILWRLPVIVFVEKFLVRNVLAFFQELADLFDGMTMDRERLTYIATKRKCGPRRLTSVEGLKDFSPLRIVSRCNRFRDHGSESN